MGIPFRLQSKLEPRASGGHAAVVGGGQALTQQTIADAIKFIFSWVVLLAIGVIVSGKLLTQKLKLESVSEQLFRIPLRGVLTIQATGAEVVLGFTAYLICVLFLGALFGSSLQPWVRLHFGIDPGQFNALGFMASLSCVAISFAVFMLSQIPPPSKERRLLQDRNRILNNLTKEKIGQDPAGLPEVKE